VHLYDIRSEATQHILDHVVGANAKKLGSDFGRQMSITQVPSEADKLIGISMRNLDNKLRGSLDVQPPPILELQAISVAHRNRGLKVEKHIFALIRSQANPAAMARVKIEDYRACRSFLRPMTSGTMN
jgi:hypothetical protein